MHGSCPSAGYAPMLGAYWSSYKKRVIQYHMLLCIPAYVRYDIPASSVWSHRVPHTRAECSPNDAIMMSSSIFCRDELPMQIVHAQIGNQSSVAPDTHCMRVLEERYFGDPV